MKYLTTSISLSILEVCRLYVLQIDLLLDMNKDFHKRNFGTIACYCNKCVISLFSTSYNLSVLVCEILSECTQYITHACISI